MDTATRNKVRTPRKDIGKVSRALQGVLKPFELRNGEPRFSFGCPWCEGMSDCRRTCAWQKAGRAARELGLISKWEGAGFVTFDDARSPRVSR